MILVAGESLMDLIVGPDGTVHAAAGGGPFNTARTIARLGQPARFLGRFSADPFGALLAGKLAADQVELELPDQVAEPTALAIVSLDDAGVARYWFHLTGTAAFQLDRQSAALALRKDVFALHVGTLGLVVEPMAGVVEDLARELPSAVLLMLDPNWREAAIPDAAAHLDRIRRLLPRTDILKTSSEDLGFLVPGRDVPEATRTLLGWSARCVLVTDGPAPVQVFAPDGRQLSVPVPPAEVVDTVGAGDAFCGGFLAWWAERELTRDQLADPALLAAAAVSGAQVAALTCTRAGAEPPWIGEVRGRPGWRSWGR
jgi:fructokinase